MQIHKIFIGLIGVSMLFQGNLSAHCQMPCGIYHDDMVYDQIDQFVETVYKGISVLNEGRFTSVRDKNEFIRWVAQKENCCNEAAEIITTYFLQQKIKPDEPDTAKRLASAHKLLFLLVAIKQNTDLDFVKQFNEEWEKFKLMFHREGYECEMEKKEFRELDELRRKQQQSAQHSHEAQEKISK
jgi:nickel superoxide dismutase